MLSLFFENKKNYFSWTRYLFLPTMPEMNLPMMNNLKIIFFFLLFIVSFLLFFNFSLAKDSIDLYFFFGQNCSASAQLAQKLMEVSDQYPSLKINAFEVWYNPQNQKLLNVLAKAYKIEPTGVPVVFVGDLAVEGFSPSTFWQIKEEVRRCSIVKCQSPIEKIKINENKPKFRWKNFVLFIGIIIFIIFLISLFKKKK